MLFQGEEYGEDAPFQFFSDHIDEEIADATREGRRREFAAFAEFAGEEVPDPQDPATFEASKLTREGEPEGLRELYATLLRAAPRAAAGRRRGESSSTSTPAGCACAAGRTRWSWPTSRDEPCTCRSTGRRAGRSRPRDVTLEPGYVVLPPLAGALVAE